MEQPLYAVVEFERWSVRRVIAPFPDPQDAEQFAVGNGYPDHTVAPLGFPFTREMTTAAPRPARRYREA